MDAMRKTWDELTIDWARWCAAKVNADEPTIEDFK
jgi:hypothetical protein